MKKTTGANAKELQLIPIVVEHCTSCGRAAHASETSDDGVCVECANFPAVVDFEGATYYATGKCGVNVKSSAPAAEYRNCDSGDARAWARFDADGKLIVEAE